MTPAAELTVRRADVVLALSLAVDLGMGRPLEHGMRSAILSVELARALGFSDEVAREAWYFVMLRLLGCTSDAADLARVASGDELAVAALLNESDWTNPLAMVGVLLGAVTRGRPLTTGARNVLRVVANANLIKDAHLTHCEVATALGAELGLEAGVLEAIGQGGEIWSGKGGPRGLKGEQLRPSVRVACLVEDFDSFHATLGFEEALRLVRSRRGKMYEPAITDVWVAAAKGMYQALGDGPLWDRALAAEPSSAASGEVPLDRQLEVMADFADLKGSFTRGHSRAVSALAEAAAAVLGLSPEERTLCRRAGLAHDVGAAAVPAHLWDKPGPLTESERERVRLHAYYTQRLLARPAPLAAIGEIAGLAHERVDGEGYPQRRSGAQLPMTARVVAAADTWDAICSPRPYRVRLSPNETRAALLGEVKSGHLDADAANAVLTAAGQRAERLKGEPPSGLSEREVEVVRLVALGKTNKEIAVALGTAPKTVDNQLQSIFKKLGVQTRGAATLHAMRAGLLR